MSDTLLLWVEGGVVAVLFGMIVAVIVARSLDGSGKASQQKFADEMKALAARAQASSATGKSKWLSGSLVDTFTALAAASETGDSPETKSAAKQGRDKMKEAMTAIAIVGGIIAVVVGIIAGDG